MVCKKQTQVIKPIIDLSFTYSIKSQWQSELNSGGFIGTILIDIYPKHTTVSHSKATESQLNYAPLIWMFCRRSCNSKIEKLHQKTLRVINSCPSTKAPILNTPNSILPQQTFVDLQDVLKTSSRHVLKTFSTRLQRNNFTSSKTS